MGLLVQPFAIRAAEAVADGVPFPLIERFENFGEETGIPAHKIHAVLKTSENQLWIGTWDGLCVREANGKFKRFGPEEGLSHKLVLCLVEDPRTGDIWAGTMRGLNRVSGGKVTKYLQTDSGLPNNVVYGIDIVDDTVWVATAAGAGALNLKSGVWKIYDHSNSIMHEPWCYAVKGGRDVIFIGVWGGGIVEHDPKMGTFKEYRDPDGDFHYILAPDSGPINDVTAWLGWSEGILWQCTYFGLARYDGKFWKTWVEEKSPLPSNFVNFAWPVKRYCWLGMDKGATTTDGETWVNYLVGEKGEGIREIHRAGRAVERQAMNTSLANSFVLGVWADENEAWFATSKGLTRGVFAKRPAAAKSAPLAVAAKNTSVKVTSAASVPPAGYREYPYYGDTPEEFLPYKGLEPYHRYWTRRLPFRGPGSDYPDPPSLKSLKVGLLVPPNYGPEGDRGQRTRKGVMLAIEEANAARKAGELPFEIIYREDSPQWGSAANIAVDFKDNDVLGCIGTIDGDATHVALRVALKTETYIINTSDPDPSLTETQIPWLTRIFPDERQQCWRLAHIIVKQRGLKRVAILRESSRPGRMGVLHFVNDIRRLGFPPVAHLLYKQKEHDIASQLQTIKAADPDAVLFHGQPEDIGYAVATFRQAGIKAQFFGFDRLKEDSFLKTAGAAAEGMTITYFFNPDKTDKPWVEFVQKYEKRWGEKPDNYVAYGYDGARMMIEAIEHAGPNRFRVRDYLANLDEWDGVTGHMIFDGRWDNIVPISTAEYKQGKWHFDPFPELKRPKNREKSQ